MLHNLLRNKKVILASRSPRRKTIMKMLNINVLQVPSLKSEITDFKLPHKVVMDLAELKAQDVAKNNDYDCVVIGADTIVSFNKSILEKPRNKEEAFRMLRILSGKSHYVYTGVAVNYKNTLVSDYVKSKVTFKNLTDDEINTYIETDEPMDKAGSYGIQGLGSQFVEKISGCYFNVMGLPANLLYDMIKDLFGEE